MLESEIENYVVNYARRRGVLSAKLNLQGRRGWPDRILLFPGGRTVFIEFKRPGGQVSKLQAYVHAQLGRLGFAVYVVKTKEQGRRIVDECL